MSWLLSRLNVRRRMYRYLVLTEQEMGFHTFAFDGQDPFVLNNLGSQGWRLRAVTRGDQYIFERRTL